LRYQWRSLFTSFEARQYVPGRISKKRREQVISAIEQLEPENKPTINLWRSSNSKQYPTRRLLSSLRFPVSEDPAQNENKFYCIMERALLLQKHANGSSLSELAMEYKFHPGAIESGLKFTVIWVLHCLAQICSPDRCYNLRFISLRCYELVENLSFGSTLGKLMSVKGVGRRSVQRLIDAGVQDFDQLKNLEAGDLHQMGIKKTQTRKILTASRRGSR